MRQGVAAAEARDREKWRKLRERKRGREIEWNLPYFQLVFDVATLESSIRSIKLDLEYFKYSRSSLTEPIDDSKVATSKTSWKHGRLRASDSIVASLYIYIYI
uniref:Uncharacterized protein n=1 Tax=Ananas comosus var. bracteatus TaxID=296719 RepID=A0A6V7PY08_ANACO|nr:unnamed protein product [Ananas comosus var. bracteatus]